MKIKELKEFDEKIKEIDTGFGVDAQFMIFHHTPAARKEYKKDNYFIEIAIYYNYMKQLVTKISKNRIISEGDGCMLSTTVETIKQDFETVNQQSKKNVLAKIEELKNVNLEAYL